MHRLNNPGGDPLWVPVCSGVLGGSAVVGVLYPLDSWKTRVQAGSLSLCPRASSSGSQAKIPLEKLSEGVYRRNTAFSQIRMLYRGYSIAIVNQVLGKGVFFAGYEGLKRELKYSNASQFLLELYAALIATTVNLLVETPLEVAKQRLQAADKYSSCRSIPSPKLWPDFVRENASYKGTGSFLIRDLVFKTLQYPLFDLLKRQVLDRKRKRQVLDKRTGMSFLEAGTCGGVAAATCGLLTMPFDVVKTRQMVTCSASPVGAGVFSDLATLARTEGVPGLFKGSGPRMLYLGGAGFIFFSAYERCLRAFGGRPSE